MIVESDHPAFISPNGDEIVWRYINLKKFKSLLTRKALFFCRADRFSDPFEGSIPKNEAEYRIKMFEGVSKFYGEPFDIKAAEEHEKAYSATHKKMKGAALINCWHINKYESDGMWQRYLKSNKGVSIKSSIDRINRSLIATPEQIYLSKIRYIDYDKDIWFNSIEYPNRYYNFFTPLVHKRKEFIHEQELRLLYHIQDAEKDVQYWNNQEFEEGMMISIDLDILIDEIVIPPTADEYIENKIKKLLTKHGMEKTIRKSRLSDAPIY